MRAERILAGDFGTLPDLIGAHAEERGTSIALIEDGNELSYAQLVAEVDTVAAAMQRHGVAQGHSLAIMAANSADYVKVYLAALSIGAVPALIAPSSSPTSARRMIAD